jgi:sec-independent protein translocase protein TatC
MTQESIKEESTIIEKQENRGRAPIMTHLKELRKRMLLGVAAILIASAGSFLFARYIFEALLAPAPSNITFIYQSVTEMGFTYAKVALYSGLALSIPFVIYQIISFINPALTSREKRYVYSLLPLILVFFAGGLAYGYFIFLPPSLNLFIEYHWVPEVGTRIVPMINIGNYISFVALALFWVGICFEFPAIIFLLAKIGLISHKWLLKRWKWATSIILLFSVLITPTGNPLSQSVSQIFWLDLGFIASFPLLFLYFFSIFLAWIARKPNNTGMALAQTQI